MLVPLKILKHQKLFQQQHFSQFLTAHKQNRQAVCQVLNISIRHLQLHKKLRDAIAPLYLKATSKELSSILIDLFVCQLTPETNFWQPMALIQKEHKLTDLYDLDIQSLLKQEQFDNTHTKVQPCFFVQYILSKQIHQTPV